MAAMIVVVGGVQINCAVLAAVYRLLAYDLIQVLTKASRLGEYPRQSIEVVFLPRNE